MDDRKERKSENLGQNIPSEPDVEVALALQDGTVADDVIHAVGQSEEHGDNEREEQVGRNVERRGEVIGAFLRVAQHCANECGEGRGGDHGGC